MSPGLVDGVGGAKGSGAEEAAHDDAVRQQDAFCGGGAGINANRIVHASSLKHFDKGGDAGAELAEVRCRIVGFNRHVAGRSCCWRRWRLIASDSTA